MGAFEFDKCCFCVDLKTGCFIIAYLSLFGYIGLAIASIFGIAVGGVVAASADESAKDGEEQQVAGVVILIGSCLLLLITVVLLTFIIVLLVGLHKNKPGHVKAYLIYASIYICISIVLFISNSVSGTNGSSIAQGLFSIILTIYFVLVIRSQYLVMKRPERGPAIYNTA